MKTPLLLVFSILLLGAKSAHAAISGLTYTVQPLVGFELDEKNVPTPHTHLSLMYGARVTGGYRVLSGEVEGTRSTSREDFVLPTLSVEDTTDRVKLGVRSTHSLTKNDLISVMGRFGGEASRTKHSETQNGATTTTTGPLYCRPYIGAGVSTSLFHGFALNAEGVAVIDPKNLKNNSYQATVSLQFSLYEARR